MAAILEVSDTYRKEASCRIPSLLSKAAARNCFTSALPQWSKTKRVAGHASTSFAPAVSAAGGTEERDLAAGEPGEPRWPAAHVEHGAFRRPEDVLQHVGPGRGRHETQLVSACAGGEQDRGQDDAARSHCLTGVARPEPSSDAIFSALDPSFM